MKTLPFTLATSPSPRMWLRSALVAVMFAMTSDLARAIDPEDAVVVSSTAAAGYVRAKNADGSLRSETYAFGVGGYRRAPVADYSIDALRFSDVARCLTASLAKQNYFTGKSPEQTQLLIMVYWGMTPGSADTGLVLGAGFSATLAAKVDLQNAGILGYTYVLGDYQRRKHTALAWRSEDEMSELRKDRYFAVLMAYDFQLMRKQKKAKLLWVTRFSIPEAGNAFNEDLPAMASIASRYFGRNSPGLVHEPAQVGKVELGELRNLGDAADPAQK